MCYLSETMHNYRMTLLFLGLHDNAITKIVVNLSNFHSCMDKSWKSPIALWNGRPISNTIFSKLKGISLWRLINSFSQETVGWRESFRSKSYRHSSHRWIKASIPDMHNINYIYAAWECPASKEQNQILKHFCNFKFN